MTRLHRALVALLLLLAPASVFAANGTLAPLAYQTVFDVNGNPVSGAKICTDLAGTTTPTTTWSEVTLTTPNPNPIIADSAGRWVAYLQTGASYKFIFQDATGTAGNCDGATIKTVDNIAAVPGSAANLDIVGTAGETLTAGQVVYLSDGSGSKTPGSWYKADSANAYSNTTPETGMVPATIASGSSGTIRQAGQITGLSALIVGTRYYAASAGAIATSGARFIGQADTTSSIVLSANPPPPAPVVNTAINGGRLTLTTLVPVTPGDVTGATSLFFTPYVSKYLALYDGTATWSMLPFADTAIPLGTLVTGQAYDVFAFNNAGTPTFETLEWANATITMTIAAPAVVTWTAHGLSTGMAITFTTSGALATGVTANTQFWVTVVDANTFKLSTSPANVAAATFITTTGSQSGTQTGHQPQARQTALVLQDGVLEKVGALTRRYIGTFLTTSTTTTEDSVLNRFLYNYTNRVPRLLQRFESTASWTYSVATVRQANGSPSNQVSLVTGVQESLLDLSLTTGANGSAAQTVSAGIGENSTNTYAPGAGQTVLLNASGSAIGARLVKVPLLGRAFYSWNEWSTNSSVTTWNGAVAAVGSTISSGLSAWILQ